jgi:hypothetical protein
MADEAGDDEGLPGGFLEYSKYTHSAKLPNRGSFLGEKRTLNGGVSISFSHSGPDCCPAAQRHCNRGGENGTAEAVRPKILKTI